MPTTFEWRQWAGGIWSLVYSADDKDLPYTICFQGKRQARFRCEPDALKYVEDRVARAKQGVLA